VDAPGLKSSLSVLSGRPDQFPRCHFPHNAAIVALVVWLLRRALSAPSAARKPPGEAGEQKGELVGCAHCGVNLPRTEARSAGGRYYCSEEHWRLGPRDG
jgi:uncharacterized protein